MSIGQFDVIAALDQARGIGLNGKLPWHLPPDLEYFHRVTTHGTVIMGRKTWDSILQRPLKERHNIILSRNLDVLPGALLSHSFEEALSLAQQEPSPIFVIGGAEIYRLALAHLQCNTLFLTFIDAQFDCDTFFPQYEDQFELKSQAKFEEYAGLRFSFCEYVRVRGLRGAEKKSSVRQASN